MQTLQSVLGQVLGEICSSLFSLEVVERAADAPMSTPAAYVGCVHIIGPASGMVAIRCEESIARYAAARMFDLSPDDVGETDIRDAVGELANVAAGNLKSNLADGYRLSMPSVVSGSDFRTQVMNGHSVADGTFETAEGTFRVTVFEEDRLAARSRNSVHLQ